MTLKKFQHNHLRPNINSAIGISILNHLDQHIQACTQNGRTIRL
uniref:Uncharacterized protein n=1 Tax=Anguilla anguilla TaxID=7936 RepID=A0A0E9WYN8_ANGAN